MKNMKIKEEDYIKFYLVVFLILIIDFFSKLFLKEKFLTLIPKILFVKYSGNTGIIFGIFSNSLFFTIILPILIILILFYYFYKKEISYLFTALIIGGLLGNLLDRFLYGFVVDFIYIPLIPKWNIFLFNIADLSLVLGIILGVVYFLKKG